MTISDDVTVLVPLHAGTAPSHLAAALDSLATQTRRAPVLVVEDGDLTNDHHDVIAENGADLQITRIAVSRRGIAGALNVGLRQVTTTWIARMDADDVAEPYRLERQSDVLESGGVDVLGSAMLEFADDPASPTGTRAMPLTHDDIVRRMRTTNPINHPTVVFRRDQVLATGGYRPLRGLEDYDLWIRMAAAGARFSNLPEPLVRFRLDDGLFARRRGREHLGSEVEIQRTLRRFGMVGRPRAVVNLMARAGYRALPPAVMRRAHAWIGR